MRHESPNINENLELTKFNFSTAELVPLRIEMQSLNEHPNSTFLTKIKQSDLFRHRSSRTSHRSFIVYCSVSSVMKSLIDFITKNTAFRGIYVHVTPFIRTGWCKKNAFFQIIVTLFIFNIKNYVNAKTTCNKCSFDYLR